MKYHPRNVAKHPSICARYSSLVFASHLMSRFPESGKATNLKRTAAPPPVVAENFTSLAHKENRKMPRNAS